MRSTPGALLTLLAAASLVLAGAPAWASDGSVPPDVRAFAADGGLLAELDDVYGDDGAGGGIPFDAETTEAGPVMRVFRFTDELLAGEAEAKPVRLVNEWAVPVSVDEQPVGVAIVWINPDTEQPELAELELRPDAAAALAGVPEAARLVRHAPTGAWFALEGDLLTPLVPGASGVAEPLPVGELSLPEPAPDPAPAEADASGLPVALAAAGALLVVIVVAIALPSLVGRRAAGRPAADAEPASASEKV